MSTPFSISADFIAEHNARLEGATTEDYDALKRALARHGIDAEALVQKVMAFGVAIPTWGVGTGGTRFARFPGPGEPRNVFEKIDDCAVIQRLARATPTISPHIPWDKVDDYAALREQAASHGLAFDAVNSNTFQDQPGQELSYKFGSLSHTDARVRAQAIAHNVECIEIGRKLGSKALTVWIADGSNFAGQSNLTKALDRYIDAMREIYRGAARRLAGVPRAQALRAGVLFDRDLRLGHEFCGGAGARAQGALPRRSRPSCAEREYRADRRPARPLQQARAASISTIPNMATTISTAARSSRSGCFWSSTS